MLENSNNNENPDFWNQEATKFVTKVNEVLHHHNGNGIKKVEVNFPLSSSHASDLDRWVAFTATSGSRTLNLILSGYHGMSATPDAERYSFPLKHFMDLRGCQLRILLLSMCSLESVSAKLSGFSYLDCLSLRRVSVVDSVVLNIMSSCRVLCQFSLQRCHQLISMRKSHAELVYLEVRNCKSLISISNYAERLECFSYKGHKVDIEYECAPILHRLHVFCVKNNECPLDFLVALPKLRSLTLQFPTYLQVHGNLQPPSKLKVIWPKKCTLRRLRTIHIRGFSGELELMRLLSFLLKRSPVLKKLVIDTHPHKYKAFSKWKRERSEDATRCNYTRGVALTHLPREIPSTVKFRVI